jgi:cobalt/nickel transport system permease protein
MAHLVDGILSPPVVVAGVALAAAGLAVGCRKLDVERIPAAGQLTAAFFVASLVHVPVGPLGIHLLLNGLLGLLLGWVAVPALFVGLLLQAALFGVGGITVLGVNTVVLGAPALLVHYLVAPHLERGSPALWGAVAGGAATAASAALVALALVLSGRELRPAAALVLAANLPLVAVEAAVTGSVVSFLRRVHPAMLAPPRALAQGRDG